MLHLFTGAHERYHTPEDTADAINAAGAAKVVDFTARVGEALALGRVTPAYAKSAAAPPMEGDRRGYGSYLGTVPDFRAMESTEGGVLLGDVRTGGPADLAGIRGGDRILAMAGTKIANLYDMTYALEDHKPGETIDVVVERNGEKKTLKATLGERRAPPEQANPGANSQANPHAPSPLPPNGGAGVREGSPLASLQGRPGPEAPRAAAAGKGEGGGAAWSPQAGKPFDKTFPGESHLKDIRQLTFGGENAEAYWSPDGRKVIYQSTPARRAVRPGIRDGPDDAATRSASRTARAARPAATSATRRATASSTPRRTAAAPTARRRRTARRATSGRSTTTYDILTALSRRLATRASSSTSPGYDAEATWNPKDGRSSSRPTATATSTSTRWTRTARTSGA